MLRAYGAACYCCGEANRAFLTLDHEAGDGAEHRARVGRNAQAQLLDLKRRGWPAGYRTACFNCNIGAGTGGVCPHAEAA